MPTVLTQVQQQSVWNIPIFPPSVSITFTDNGIPYNPLTKSDPDTTLSAEEREIGGLGIFIVKKMMDEVFYEYHDNKNCLTIRKIL